MKTVVIAICFLFFSSAGKAQQILADTIRRNEITVNVLPVFLMFSGGTPQYNSNFHFGYNRYLKHQKVFRLGISFFPFRNNDQNNGSLMYDRTFEDKVIYKSYYHQRSAEIQLHTGLEKLFHFRRFIHGLGADLLLSHRQFRRTESYEWRYVNQPLYQFPFFNDSTNYSIDTLGFRERDTEVGIGVHVFYSLRYQMSKRFYLSLTSGISLAYVINQGTTYDGRTKKTVTENYGYVDLLPMPLISNLSICYRF